MMWGIVPLVLQLAGSVILTAFFAIYFWKRRTSILGSVPLFTVMAAAALWSLCEVLGITSPGPYALVLVRMLENAVIMVITIAFVQFSLQYSARVPRRGSVSWLLLMIIPGLMAVSLLVSLLLPVFHTGAIPPLDLSIPESQAPGPVFWIYYAYGIFLVLTGLAVLLQHYQSTTGVFRGQLACLLIAILPPLFVYSGFVFRISPFNMIDLAPVTFSISVMAIASGMEQFSLFDLVPLEQGAVIRQIPAGILVLDENWRIIEINPAARRLLEITDRDLVGATVGEILPQKEVAELQQSGARSERRQTLKRESDGDTRYFDLRCIPLTLADQKHRGFVILFADITEQQRVDLSLSVARKKINVLTSITRHDILNQLTVIMAHNEILGETLKDPSLTKSITEEERAAKNIRRQIEFTKDYDRLGENPPRWINVQEHFLHQTKKPIYQNIRFSVHAEGLEIFADPLFDKVFENLLDNSLRFGMKVTLIRLSYLQHNEGLTLMYEDDGVGVPEKDKGRIFQRGFGKNGGYGLFFSNEILGITNISMKETGKEGEGVRFEISVPANMFRIHQGTYSTPAGPQPAQQ